MQKSANGVDYSYVGTEKFVGRGRRKSVTGWGVGVKISPQEGGQFEEQGRGREGELLQKKNARKQCFCAKNSNFFVPQGEKLKIS